MANRTCTSCLRGEPDVCFESSSGGWCYFCMSALRLREWQQSQEKREYWQWLCHTDHKPYVPEKVGKNDKRYRG
jgi:hypothetical protein